MSQRRALARISQPLSLSFPLTDLETSSLSLSLAMALTPALASAGVYFTITMSPINKRTRARASASKVIGPPPRSRARSLPRDTRYIRRDLYIYIYMNIRAIAHAANGLSLDFSKFHRKRINWPGRVRACVRARFMNGRDCRSCSFVITPGASRLNWMHAMVRELAQLRVWVRCVYPRRSLSFFLSMRSSF